MGRGKLELVPLPPPPPQLSVKMGGGDQGAVGVSGTSEQLGMQPR